MQYYCNKHDKTAKMYIIKDWNYFTVTFLQHPFNFFLKIKLQIVCNYVTWCTACQAQTRTAGNKN